MAAETEIDKLVVRIVGDNEDYVKKMNQNAEVTQRSADKMVDSLEKVEKAQDKLRDNPMLDELFESLSGGAAPIQASVTGMEKRIQQWASTSPERLAAVQKAIEQQNAADARYTQEAIRRDKERTQVAKQLAKERADADKKDMQDSLGAIMGMRGGSGATPLGDVDFEKPTKSAIGFGAALGALGSVMGVLHAAQTAMQNDMDKFNDSMREGDQLDAKLSEQRAYQFRQKDETYASLPVKERIDLQKEELAQLQKIVETQKSKHEADKRAVEDARGPMFVGSTLRGLPGIGAGKQAELEAAEKNASVSNARLEETIKRIKDLQRTLADTSEGGDQAEQAMNRFRLQMERQTQSVIEGRKAVILFNLEQHNLSEEQKKEAEEIYQREKTKQEAFRAAQQASEDYFQAELKRIDEIDRTNKEFMSPLEKYAERKKELDEMLEGGLSQGSYNRALDDAKKKYDHATEGAKKFHHEVSRGSAILYGSVEAQERTAAQVQMLSSSPSGTATAPKGPRDDEMAEYLKTIAENTKKGLSGGATIAEIAAANI